MVIKTKYFNKWINARRSKFLNSTGEVELAKTVHSKLHNQAQYHNTTL